MKTKTPKTLHPIDSFGISKVSLSSIRVEKLEDRVAPKVPFPHKHDFYQLILITSGGGDHSVDFKKYKVQKTQFYLLKPAQIHTWSLDAQIRGWVVEFNESTLTFSGNSLNLIQQLEYAPDLIALKKNEFLMMEKIIQQMSEEFEISKELMDECLKAHLSTLLIHILRHTGLKTPDKIKHEGILDKFRILVETHFKEEHRVEFYAKSLGTTAKALTMQITRALGRSPRLLIQDRFLLEAKRYLAYSELNISDVGFKIGFEDANYFSRFFKLHERMTPAQFRERFSNRG